MAISRAAEPRFNPYGDDDPQLPDGGPWLAPTSSGPVIGVVSVPGSKSLTNRQLVLAALADGPSRIRMPLHSRDTLLMVDALRALGATIEPVPGDGSFGPDLVVTPGELGGASIACGLAGTVMRFVPPVAALALGPVSFDGDPAARRRPMAATIEALRALGVDVADDGRGALPFSLYGTGAVRGGRLELDASASSQFVSGLLMAAPRFDEGLHLVHTGPSLPSLEHIRMTVECLAERGVAVRSPAAGEWMVEPGPIAARDVRIEPDLSNAGPFLAAALVTGGSVTVRRWPEASTQVGMRMPELLGAMGASSEFRPTGDGVGDLTVSGHGRIHGAAIEDAGELAPTLAAVACLADSPTVLTGIAHLRGHETDRLAALVAEISALGGTAVETSDGLRIEPSPLSGGPWRAYEDHRMATAGAIIGLAVPGVLIDDIGSTAKTLPEFPDLWRTLVAPQEAAAVVPLEDPDGSHPPVHGPEAP